MTRYWASLVVPGDGGPALLDDEASTVGWIAAWGHAMFVAGGLDSETQLARTGA